MEGPGSNQVTAAASMVPGSDCPAAGACEHCFWHVDNDGFCSGCDGDCHERCYKSSCDLACERCGGGRHAETQGCCGRATVLSEDLRHRLREILETPVPRYSPEPLSLSCPLIPIIYGQTRRHRLAERFPEIDGWAVPIHKTADRSGRFRSRDLKDYLGLPADRKLILSTCAPDDFQEMLWQRGVDMDFAAHGIDYWFPAHFSIYDNDCNLYQFLSAKRQQLNAVETESRFVWFRLADSLPIDFLEPVRRAPSVLISSQQIFSKRNRAVLDREVALADDWFPAETAFYLIGNILDLPISATRRRYSINSRWLMLSLKGRDLENKPVKDLPLADLLARNLEQMLNRIQEAWN